MNLTINNRNNIFWVADNSRIMTQKFQHHKCSATSFCAKYKYLRKGHTANHSFVITKDELETIAKILSKIPTFSIAEYSRLSDQERSIIRNYYEKKAKSNEGVLPFKPDTILYDYITYEETEKIHTKTANMIKTNLDKQYGKGKYSVLLPGRSLSSIGKSLGYIIGEESVINFPLSGAERYNSNQYIEDLNRSGAIAKFKAYLNKLGLNKDKFNSSQKQFVIIDFCATGKSLKGTKKLLQFIFQTLNIETIDILDCIKEDNFRNYLKHILHNNMFKQISYVEKCSSLNNIFNSPISDQNNINKFKLLRFKLLDNQMQINTETNTK